MEHRPLKIRIEQLVELVWQSAATAGTCAARLEATNKHLKFDLRSVTLGTVTAWNTVVQSLSHESRKSFIFALTERAETTHTDLSDLKHYPKPTEYHAISRNDTKLMLFLFELVFAVLQQAYRGESGNSQTLVSTPKNPFSI